MEEEDEDDDDHYDNDGMLVKYFAKHCIVLIEKDRRK
jgi:hypothetical protein